MAYKAVNDMSNQWGHFRKASIVPRGRIPEDIFKSWIKDGVIVQEHVDLETLEDEDEADLAQEAAEDEADGRSLEENEGDDFDDEEQDPEAEENVAADPSLSQPVTKRPVPDFGKPNARRPGRKKTPPAPGK